MTHPDIAPFLQRGARVPELPLVSVSVLVLSDPRLVIGCLDSLLASNPEHAIETLVVANGTPPNARLVLEDREDIILVRSGTNLGFSGGNNLAAKHARGRYLFLLNDDSIVEEGCIDRLLATAERDDSIGAVGSRILSADGSLQEAGSVLYNDGTAAHVGLGLPEGSTAFSYVRDVDYTSANGLLVRRAIWDSIGGLDERYFPAYYEDVDLCMTLRQRGCRVVFEPRARIRHLESQSTSSQYRKFLLLRNRQRFVEKWSAELAQYADAPIDADPVAVARAVEQARGSPPRLLVFTTTEDTHMWEAVEALANRGWAPTVLTPTTAAHPDQSRDRSMATDRLIDLGVDIPGGDVQDLLAVTGSDFEAVLVGSTSSWHQPPIIRLDGTEIPVVRASDWAGDDHVGAAIRTIVDAARRTPKPPDTSVDGWHPPVTTDGVGIKRAPNVDGASPTVDQPEGEGQAPSEQVTQARRELEFARAEVALKDEYIATFEPEISILEARLDEALGFLREKTAYIESLPMVRLKIWVNRLGNRSRR